MLRADGRLWIDPPVSAPLDGGESSIVAEARAALVALQRPDGHWLFELEADVTISAEYIFLQHYLDEIDPAEEGRIAAYIRGCQASNGGWPLFEAGEPDLSATVKAYYALKLAGDDPDAPHMIRARSLILSLGGAAKANVFTRIALALFGQVPWRAVPAMPVELMLLPRRSPFHVEKISYWSRTVIVPLLILMALRPQARNPRGVHIRELFLRPPEDEQAYITHPADARLGPAFLHLDRLLREVEPRFPRGMRQRAIQAAIDFIEPRLNGDNGLGAIFPAMANVVMAFDAIGRPKDDPAVQTAKQAIRKLLVDGERTYCQPCLSPVWDTALAMHALLEAGETIEGAVLDRAAQWLLDREIAETRGDWTWKRPLLPPSGWAFQYRNDHYPDVDDTAVVAMALHRADPDRYRACLERACAWIVGIQSRSGGWGAFDVDNTYHYLNAIPFADHGALLDPPTVDVTARCVSMLAQLGLGRDHDAVRRGVAFIRREQEPDGSWYGRWGVNYVYGTWSALCALNAVGEPPDSPAMRRAGNWLKARQNPDGGWGEDCASYAPAGRDRAYPSTPSQTAWAVLALMAAGEGAGEAARRGAAFLESAPRQGARWREEPWTGTGFPRVFYLKYHGYAAYFPLWALARYKRLLRGETRVPWGM
ncbi:squalene--hopene cyclase [Salinarimonas soli]|uniref:Squalene--hopene cyclase n=1 Tax=Salinarimonas soli TaxID=1638099 RepID=A0A5B2V9J3_9HYPH|nr:squalene--hopene cyclase [Salinarimonas soli]KAA2235681.1 squalene--hopene cyclase [Salinarimonas soli]